MSSGVRFLHPAVHLGNQQEASLRLSSSRSSAASPPQPGAKRPSTDQPSSSSSSSSSSDAGGGGRATRPKVAFRLDLSKYSLRKDVDATGLGHNSDRAAPQLMLETFLQSCCDDVCGKMASAGVGLHVGWDVVLRYEGRHAFKLTDRPAACAAPHKHITSKEPLILDKAPMVTAGKAGKGGGKGGGKAGKGGKGGGKAGQHQDTSPVMLYVPGATLPLPAPCLARSTATVAPTAAASATKTPAAAAPAATPADGPPPGPRDEASPLVPPSPLALATAGGGDGPTPPPPTSAAAAPLAEGCPLPAA
ncbi:hypothetical protein HYH02_001274 [Chlamydomonas schloesseri]|uniref:Uncharacterized protein n=1 Tax=Chlamydomonas schloesseri TaxID=2026947 RepID=A0A835WV18_9CHLO|nr:hypothetical protein HYH02_001274 [Chlamydomonas schloesseri]|eukprot:KAG2454240.1 hypothetical protein HYH02_001274 [Chlamydomonas schloesseri]